MTPHLAEGEDEVEQMLCPRTTNTLMLPEGAILAEAECDRRGWGLHLAALPRESLYRLQDGEIAQLWVREGCTLEVLSELKANLEQLSLQRNNLLAQNKGIEKEMEEAYSSILEFAMPMTIPTEEKIHKLAARVHKTQEESMKVQLELNLQITELQLKA